MNRPTPDAGRPPVRHAVVHADPAFTAGAVPPRLFGSFVEHMGRCVYTGLYEPGHPAADAGGLRGDVLDLVREIRPGVVRYPGGNFVSAHRWEDAVGPVAGRPRRLDPAWRSVETHEFGLHEFMGWAARAGVEPMMAVNLGTRGVTEAIELLEYCNHPGGTALSDLRRSHGADAPFDVRLWCLGNEMDGPWQVGHKTAAEYGRLATETGRAMRLVDPRIELVACGSSDSSMPTFGEWEQTVLELAYDQVDYISAHAYYEERDGDADSFLASAVDMDHMIESVVATADSVRARGRHRRRVHVSFDEWNVWYRERFHAGGVHRQTDDWAVAPRVIEDGYSVTDAVVVGTLLNSLLRHGNRVRIGCQAQLVNVIGMIRSEPGGPAWRQTVSHPFELARRFAAGDILDLRVDSDTYPTARYGDVPVLDAAGTHDPATGAFAVFLANRDRHARTEVEVRLPGAGTVRPGSGLVVTTGPGQDRHAGNDAARPDRVTPGVLTGVRPVVDGLRVVLPPLSWAVVPFDGHARST